MFDALISAIITIAEVCINLVELLFDLVMWIVTLIAEAPKLLNPVFILNEIIAGTFLGIKTIVNGIVDIFKPPRFGIPNECNNTGEGIFGFRRQRDGNGNIIADLNNTGGKRCVKPTTLKILITMICPPLGLFLHLGIAGWFHIIVCTFLTIKLYYFPGFLYSIMHIIC